MRSLLTYIRQRCDLSARLKTMALAGPSQLSPAISELSANTKPDIVGGDTCLGYDGAKCTLTCQTSACHRLAREGGHGSR